MSSEFIPEFSPISAVFVVVVFVSMTTLLNPGLFIKFANIIGGASSATTEHTESMTNDALPHQEVAMVRITVTKHNDEKLEIVEYDVLAWLSWPFDLLLTGYQKLIATVELMAKGSCVVASQEWCKEFFIPSGEVRNPARHQVVKGTLLPPCCRKWRYEARSDYVSAAVDGVGSSMICRGKTIHRHRNGH